VKRLILCADGTWNVRDQWDEAGAGGPCAGRTVAATAVVGGVLLPGSIGEKVEGACDKYLFRGATLQDLAESPYAVINATNVQSGTLWLFSKAYMADYSVGRVAYPQVSLALAVADSSALPPVGVINLTMTFAKRSGQVRRLSRGKDCLAHQRT
jgi:hypothetical protein